MKKLLAIVVLGLLLSNNAYAEISYVCIYPDDKKKDKYNFLIENGKVYREDFLEKQGHNSNDCYWMVHEDAIIYVK